MQYRQPRHRSAIWSDDPGLGVDIHRLLRAHVHARRIVPALLAQHRDERGPPVRDTPAPLSIWYTRIGVMPLRSSAPGAAGGMLFSTAQATMHAPHPLQRSMSIVMP